MRLGDGQETVTITMALLQVFSHWFGTRDGPGCFGIAVKRVPYTTLVRRILLIRMLQQCNGHKGTVAPPPHFHHLTRYKITSRLGGVQDTHPEPF